MNTYNLKQWSGFPGFTPDELNDVLVSSVSYMGETIELGDTCIWKYPGHIETSADYKEVKFKIDAIRLNPTLRFYDGETCAYYLAFNCVKIIE